MFIFCLHDNLCVLSDIAVVWSICLVQAGRRRDRQADDLVEVGKMCKYIIFENLKYARHLWESSLMVMSDGALLKNVMFFYIFFIDAVEDCDKGGVGNI